MKDLSPYPILLNIFIFLNLLYTYTYVYSSKCVLNRRYDPTIHYFYFGLLIILNATFSFFSEDYYNYWEGFYEVKKYGEYPWEPLQVWIISMLPDSFFFWRFFLWGLSAIIVIRTIQRLKLDIKTTICYFTIVYLSSFSTTRQTIGVSLLFYGISFLIKPDKRKLISYVKAIIFITLSFFFHKSMIVPILMVFTMFLKPNKKFVLLSLFSFPIMAILLKYSINSILEGNILLDSEDDTMGTMQRFSVYAEADKMKSNFMGIIYNIIDFAPKFITFLFLCKKFTFDRIKAPKYIYMLYTYIYCISYYSYLFYFQDVSQWFYIRFLMFSYLPIVFVLSYIAFNYRLSLMMKLILILYLLNSSYGLLYSFYYRFKLL